MKTPGDAELQDVKFDFIVCTNKAINMVPSASEQIAPAVSKDTTIVVIQNGVGNADQFRERFPNNVVLSAVVSPTLSFLCIEGCWEADFGGCRLG